MAPLQVVATKGRFLEANEEVSSSLVTVSPFRQLICICVSLVVKILQFTAVLVSSRPSFNIFRNPDGKSFLWSIEPSL